MPTPSTPRTVGELRAAGYRPKTVREEIHANLVRKLEAGEPLFPGIVGYEESVIPELTHALLAGQHVIVLGERGQAKSRLIRAMIGLLDPEVPVVAGSELNDDPLAPVSPAARRRLAEEGDALAVEWLPRERRYGEKLATPDVAMADLIGDVDPIRVAEGRYLADELTIHYGLIPRTNRGIFCVNELPDLAERIQVGLFNLMEERDVQIKGYRIRLPLDLVVFATANPEDYTNRGRIITPLKDRFGAQIRTHYPRSAADELAIVEQERTRFGGAEQRVVMPDYMAEIVAEISALARKSGEINQRSGVSVRVSIANAETLRSAALRRALRLGEKTAAPRITDLPAIVASMRGKIELESVEEGREDAVVEELTKRAVAAVFARRLPAADLPGLVGAFEDGLSVTTGSAVPAAEYVRLRDTVKGLRAAAERLAGGGSPAETAAAVEFVLEGLHLHRRLNRERVGGGYAYRRATGREADETGGRPRRERRREE
ncbi:MAG TPA: magnesium chelatase [Methylomirabilota bacterium]|nr:magnesium chelatase [Methylomirabilota bacterium]